MNKKLITCTICFLTGAGLCHYKYMSNENENLSQKRKENFLLTLFSTTLLLTTIGLTL